jgi:hypothetical protein
MVIGALAPNGTEYQVTYKSDFESFQHFLPTFESMVKSFRTTGSEKLQTTGNGSAVTDFSLGDGGIGGSNATTDSVRNTTGSASTNSSSNDDFSLGD